MSVVKSTGGDVPRRDEQTVATPFVTAYQTTNDPAGREPTHE